MSQTALTRLREATRGTEYEGRLFLVGGYVRDKLLGKPAEAGDLDLVLEGDAPDGMVMLKFDSAEQARAWYESPQYQAALPHRIRCGDWKAFIVEGV